MKQSVRMRLEVRSGDQPPNKMTVDMHILVKCNLFLYLLKVREKFAQIAPECISEHLISNFLWGSMSPDPLVATMLRYAPHGCNRFTIASPH